MIGLLTGRLRRWLSQEQARANAAQAAVRLQHRRRQRADVDAFLALQHHRSTTSRDQAGMPTTQGSHLRGPRQPAH